MGAFRVHRELSSPDRLRAEAMALVARLSERERRVLELITLGHGNRSIAESLRLNAETIKTHRAKARLKLGASCTADMVRVAIRAGLGEYQP